MFHVHKLFFLVPGFVSKLLNRFYSFLLDTTQVNSEVKTERRLRTLFKTIQYTLINLEYDIGFRIGFMMSLVR